MTCPKCQSTIDAAHKVCPECGTGLYRNVSGVIRTSAVMISADGEDNFYHSVQEVPERLRQQLIESTAGDNSGTIVIADRAGKEQLTQALARRESARPQLARPFADLSLSNLAQSGLTQSGLTQSGSAQSASDQTGLRSDSGSALQSGIERTALHRLARLPWIAWAGVFVVLASAIGLSVFFGMRW
jgi:hypothetical protein